MKDAAKFARGLSLDERHHFIRAEEHRIHARLASLKLTDPTNEKERRRLKRELSAIGEVRAEGLGAALVELQRRLGGRSGPLRRARPAL
jgi:hypothetical protein